MTVTIYSTSMCAECGMLVKWLEKEGKDYTKKVTDTDPAIMTEFMQVNDGHIGVPFTVIEKDGETIKIPGFDKKKFEAAFE